MKKPKSKLNGEEAEIMESGEVSIPNLRIKQKLYDKFSEAIKEFNSTQDIDHTITQCHRMALKDWSQRVMNGDFNINFDSAKD